jgi:hypothetical protein
MQYDNYEKARAKLQRLVSEHNIDPRLENFVSVEEVIHALPDFRKDWAFPVSVTPLEHAEWDKLAKLSGLPSECRKQIECLIAFYQANKILDKSSELRKQRGTAKRIRTSANNLEKSIREAMKDQSFLWALERVAEKHPYEDASPAQTMEAVSTQLLGLARLMKSVEPEIRARSGPHGDALRLMTDVISLIVFHHRGKIINRAKKPDKDGGNLLKFATDVCTRAGAEALIRKPRRRKVQVAGSPRDVLIEQLGRQFGRGVPIYSLPAHVLYWLCAFSEH